MPYYSLFKYSVGTNPMRFTSSTACFRVLYNQGAAATKVSMYLFDMEGSNRLRHKLCCSPDEIEFFFKSFKTLFVNYPEIEHFSSKELKKEIGDNYEDLTDNNYEVNGGTKVTFNIANTNQLYIKFVTTLTRYLYEKENDNAKIVKRYLHYRKLEKYSKIPSIELFQLCHSNCYTHTGHMFFSCGYDRNFKVYPIKENIVSMRLLDGKLSQINDVFNGIRDNNSTPFEQLIDNY